MTEVTAIILSERGAEESARKIFRLLDFFGVAGRIATIEELLLLLAEKNGVTIRILGSAKHFIRLSDALKSQPETQTLWANRVHSAFCFVEDGGDILARLLSSCAPRVRIAGSQRSDQTWTVSTAINDFTGPMAGLQVGSVTHPRLPVQLCATPAPDMDAIISNPAGAVFSRHQYNGAPFFLSTSDVIDIDTSLPGRDFDIRPHFLAAVPAVLYVKWAFAEMCWQPPETTACLIIDDPLLRPRYGHLNYQHLLALMERLNFSTSIAFIPWNWRRSSSQTVRIFRENPGRFSIAIHGCDHTAGEYGICNRDRLAWKSRQSIQRMAHHCRQTNLPHDLVMVFPQGVFSGAAMTALKHGDFIGTVNSEVISADPSPCPVTISDYWNVAVMKYSDFPIFTRRYPWAGVENFAFDILLGKPCLLVIHHNDCHDGYQCLEECIKKLNRLNTRVRWTNLAEVVRRSFRQREIPTAAIEIEMYGSEMRIENPSIVKKLFRLRKRESAPDAIREVLVAEQPVKWSSAGGQIYFETELTPGEIKTVAITFKEIPLDGVRGEGLYYEAKVMLRRYLCEVRDNYLMQKSFSK